MRAAAVIGIIGAVLLCSGLPGAARAETPSGDPSPSVAPAPAIAHSCGCGVLVSPKGSSVAVTRERAIVHWSHEEETIQLMVDAHSDSHTAGIIVPTPRAADVTAGDPRLFGLVENLIQPETHVETDWWGLGYLRPSVESPGVTVLDRVRVGELETTVLAASDAPGLTTWLTKNDFAVSAETTEALQNYVELGWSFAVIKLAADSNFDGRVDPIALTFDTERLIYPMRLAHLSAEPYDLRLYVFDEKRTHAVKASAPTVDLDGNVTVAWAGAVSDRRLTELGPYLTVLDVHFDDPQKEISGDIGIVESDQQGDVTPELTEYRMVTLLGVPVGTLVLVWALLGIAIAFGHLVGRRRAR